MRKIVIIQAIIILVGAFYIYTLHTSEVVEDTTTIRVVPAAEQPALPAPAPAAASSNESVRSESAAETTITGPSDVGMEFPIPDDESLLQE